MTLPTVGGYPGAQGSSDNHRLARPRGRGASPATAAIAPLFVVALLFLVVPIVGMAVVAFTVEDDSGATSFGLENFVNVGAQRSAVTNSIMVSGVASVIAALIGAVTAWSLAGLESRRLESATAAIGSVLATDGGAPLAFSFIVTLGNSGVVFTALNLGSTGFTLYSWQGLVAMYQYFLIPTMIIVMMPTFAGIRREWREANTVLGGTGFTFWRRVGIPVAMPALIGGWVLLFGAAFATYACAAVLMSGGTYALIPLQIASGLESGTQAGSESGAMALGISMVVIAVVVLLLFNRLQRLSMRWMQ